MKHTDDAGGPSATGDADFKYGPVEVYLIGFDGERPGTEVVDAILDLVPAGSVRLLDLLFVSRSRDGDLRVLELEEIADQYGLAGLEVVEHVWAKKFAETLFRAGGSVLQAERIPAPFVNELVVAASA